MSILKLAGNSVAGELGTHLQIVLQNGSSELEIEVQTGVTWQVKTDQDHKLGSNYGVVGSYGVANLDIGSRNSDDVWALLKQAAADFDAMHFPYYNGVLESQNSNTFAYSMLLTVGINASQYFETVQTGALIPGIWDVRDRVTFTIAGTSGEDWFFAGAQNDTLNGGEGNDTLNGGGGQDTINGGAGDDRLYGGGDNDTINGGAGEDYIEGEGGSDTIHGGADLDRIVGGGDDDKLYGDEGNDLIWGDAGKDELFGDEGDDNLYGGSGDDKLNGGEGDDELYAGADKDELIGGVGADRLDGGEGVDTVSYATSEEAVRVNLDTGVGSGGDAAGDNGGDTYISIENVVGSDFDDVIIGNAGDNKLEGGDGADVLIGGDGKDELLGGEGADVLLAGRLRGDNPQGSSQVTETVTGGAGTDYLVVTSEQGATIIIDDGDVEDRLLIHESLLDTSLVSSEGDVPMFACSLKQKGTPCGVPFHFNL